MFRYQGLLYRALNPLHAREPLSGAGAQRHGGRFNPQGLPALYTSRSVMTAVREANQVGTLQPTTLVAYEADIGPLFDAADPAALAARRMTVTDLAAGDWRARMRAEGEAPTQRLARALIEEGYAGMQVASFAAGSAATDLNLVLWTWGPDLPVRLRLVDGEGRLA